jgi:hypothetical protein
MQLHYRKDSRRDLDHPMHRELFLRTSTGCRIWYVERKSHQVSPYAVRKNLVTINPAAWLNSERRMRAHRDTWNRH